MISVKIEFDEPFSEGRPRGCWVARLKGGGPRGPVWLFGHPDGDWGEAQFDTYCAPWGVVIIMRHTKPCGSGQHWLWSTWRSIVIIADTLEELYSEWSKPTKKKKRP